MKTVTAVSGGKSSSMMAIKYPTDYYLFAVVLTDHVPSAPKDPGLLRECVKRIPHFVASLEADQTLSNMLKLEQEIGKEIRWVSAEYSLDRFVYGQTDLPGYRSGKKMLPNKLRRFCTQQQKLVPSFHHAYFHWWDGDPLLTNIGLRYDEPHRINNWTCENDTFRYARACLLTKSRNCQYESVDWRISNFPLNEDKITREDVVKYWDERGWEFPAVSNCRFCFQHRDLQQQYQAELEPENLQWWLDMEAEVGATFGTRSLNDILSQPLLDGVMDKNEEDCSCTD